ncbi:CaiB/BaiF CoA transferase family protein [Paenarthrobacter sp. NEAU-H11]|uniref:CaiB/BaiF CoA transferase family protein n=1 Tax=Paenarthrobacter sp. NEAU-H11 TaxID=3423924 RepID=UPI003D33BDBF
MKSQEVSKAPTSGPLAGLRVLEFAGLGPAPFACMHLAELGAEVIRIDRPSGAGLTQIPIDSLNRSRPNLVVDLKKDEGADVVLRLAQSADVVVEGWRPGVAERLGVGPEQCRVLNPGLIYARITGWGQTGPMAPLAGHDINYAALSGALHATGGREKPRQAANLIADFGGGALPLLVGVLSALHARANGELGQVVEVAMVDGAASLSTMIYGMHARGLWKDEREQNLLDGQAPFYDTYRCADGKFIAVGSLEPQFFTELCAGLGLQPDDYKQYDQQQWPKMRAHFEGVFATRSRDQWARLFEQTDACVSPVLSLAEAPMHPHNQSRGTFVPLGEGHEPTFPARFSRTPTRTPGPVRPPGADTRAVLGGAGFPGHEIDALLASRVVIEYGEVGDLVPGIKQGIRS